MNNTIKNGYIVKAEDIIAFIRKNFGKIRGTLSCLNPHWWLHFRHDCVVYHYECCDYEYCDHKDYDEYKDCEELIRDHFSTLTGNDDWSWINSQS